MKTKWHIISLFILFASTFLMGCSGKDESQSTMEGTAEAFVQALIDGDEEVIGKLNRDATNPTEYVIQEEAPKFSGISIDDLSFEYDKDKHEVLVENKDGSIRYWLDIEKIGEEYFVTKIV